MTGWRSWEDGLIAGTLTVLVVCIAVGFVALLQNAVSGLQGGGVALLCALVALESYLTHRRPSVTGEQPISGARARLAELAGIFIVVQLLVDMQDGQQIVQRWVPHLDETAGLLFAPLFVIWAVSGSVAGIVSDLQRPLSDPGPNFAAGTPERRLAARFFVGGLILFIVTGLTQPSVADLLHIPRGSGGGPVLNVLVYFLLGVIVLGQVHFASLRRRWQHQQVAVAAGLSTRWLGTTALFVLALLLVAFILPTNRTAGLLDPWRQAWDQMVLLMQGPLTWLVKLLGHTAQPIPRITPIAVTPPPKLHGPPPPHSGGAHAAGWGSVAQALFFWIAIAMVVIYLLRVYLRGRARRLRLPGFLGGFAAGLVRLWVAALRAIRGYADAVSDQLPRLRFTAPMPRESGPRLRSLLHLGSPSAREQAMRYYLAVLRRAEREGVPRRLSQTPYEFSRALGTRLPEAHTDLSRLTDAYVEARYSPHEFAPERLDPLRSSWHRVRSALSAIRKPAQ